MTADKNLHFANTQVLYLVQALLGLISLNMRAVSISCSHDQVQLTFVLYCESEDSLDEITDIVFEYEALQQTRIDISVAVVIDSAQPVPELVLDARLVFLRKA